MLTATHETGTGAAGFLQRTGWPQLVEWSDLTASPQDAQLLLAARPQILAARGPSRQDQVLWRFRETRFSSKLGRSESWGLGRWRTTPR